MIGKGSEAIQRQQQRQQSTKRWRGMEGRHASSAMERHVTGNGQCAANNNQPNDGAAWRLGAMVNGSNSKTSRGMQHHGQRQRQWQTEYKATINQTMEPLLTNQPNGIERGNGMAPWSAILRMK
jgi:hypothetical protein